MDRKALAYSGLLLVSLVVVSFLLSRGSIQAVLNPGDVTLTTTSTPNVVGEPRTFNAELIFPTSRRPPSTVLSSSSIRFPPAQPLPGWTYSFL